MKSKSQKQINLELLRVISMLMIITLHFLGHGNILSTVPPYTPSYYFAWTLEGICYISVNCYILISGYFLVDSHFKLKKLFNLILQVFFYSIFIYIILCILGYIQFSPLNLLKAFTPTLSGEYWFFTVYIGMYILSPFINILINNMNSKQHLYCIFVSVALFSIHPSIMFYSQGLNFGGGTGIVWFLVLYLIAAYIKRYYHANFRPRAYIILYIIFSALVPISKFTLEICSKYTIMKISSTDSLTKLIDKIYQYNSFFVLCSSVLIFILFLNIKDDFLSKKILYVSPLCFGIYLIHDNNYIRSLLWGSINPTLYTEKWYFPLLLFFIVILIFICCSFIEFIRNKLFRFIAGYININVGSLNIATRIKNVIFHIIHNH
ncbi:MAG: hypothetical protein RHS_4971 [Robinsoniella sp. RHS]|uniref:acyltransferase n=1 Tax=Robinsoniella sp. RHS TaxID=1504536 RepID=UPI000649B3D4|nr:MAG: hypothetical protein RHS_4971 [Robinsoniella sp. RHS]